MDVRTGLRSMPPRAHLSQLALLVQPPRGRPGLTDGQWWSDTSMSGAVRRMCSESPTSSARDSYETFLRSGGSISICWWRIRMALSRLTCQYACVRERGEGTPVVALRCDVIFPSDTRGEVKSMNLSYQTSECEAFRAPPIFPEACEEPAWPSRG
jgi:hypothetical protein